MSKKRSDVFAETIVGIFMAAVLALLVYFTIVISGVDILVGHTKVPMKVEFTDVGGLKDRDSVMYRGMKVGVIDHIDLSKTNVVMTVRVTSDVVLREGYRISVASLSLLGGNYLLLEEGAGKPLPLETTLFRGEPPTDWMRDIGRIASSVGDLMSDGGLKSIVTNIEAVAAKLNVVVTRVERGEGTVGKLLSSDETVYNDLKDTISSAKAVAGRLERGEGTVGKFLSSDETVYNDIKDTVAAGAIVPDTVVFGGGWQIGKIDSGYSEFGQEWSTPRDYYAANGNLREVTERLKDGKGLLGRLTQDEKLSADASAMIEKLAAASTDLATVR